MRIAAALRVLLLLAPLALPTPLTGQAAGRPPGSAAQPEVVDLSFEGNEAFSPDSLRLVIVNRETECRTALFKWALPLCPLGLDFAFDRQYLFPRELSRDALRLEVYYYQRGYREAQVDTSLTVSEDGEEASITFHIEEGRPVLVDSLVFTGIDDLDPGLREDILARLPIQEGRPLSAILLNATRDSLQLRLMNRGHARADILRNLFIPNETPYLAEVEYDIAPGPLARFGEIEVLWPQDDDPSLTEEVVRRMLPFGEGDVYGRDLLLVAQRNLFGLEIIRSASIQEDTTEMVDSIVPVTVRIAEADVHRVRAAAGWSSADCLNSEAQWTSRNFMGGARRLQIRGRVSNVLAESLHGSACPQSGEGEFGNLNWLASAELHQPWLFSTRNSLTVSVFAERQSVFPVFIRRAVGVNLSVSRTLAPRTPLTLSFRPQLSSLEAAEIFFCTSFLVCAPGDVDVLQGANWLSPVGLSLSRSRTDNILNPSRGYQALLDLEHASGVTGSDFLYNRVIAEGSYYHDLARRTVLASRLRAGWIGGGEFGALATSGGLRIIHPQKRFFAGGANSVRGFPQNRLGPRVLTLNVMNLLGHRPKGEGEWDPPVCSPEEVAGLQCDAGLLPDERFFPSPTGGTRVVEGSLEYRFGVSGPFQGVGFLDFGQVWGENEALSLKDVEWTPGVGVRYFSPIGPIRVDVGYRFRGGQELRVVTSRIRPFDLERDDPGELICVQPPGPEAGESPGCDGGLVTIPWVRLDELAILDQPVIYGQSRGFLPRLQLHFSIGQAF